MSSREGDLIGESRAELRGLLFDRDRDYLQSEPGPGFAPFFGDAGD